MENIKEEELKKEDLPSEPEKKEEQDPLKTELDKVQKKEGKYTRKEKLIYQKKQIEKQLREEDEEGIEPQIEVDDDDKPVTVGMFKKMQKDNAVKNALQLADEIDNETERELVKHHINNTIRSTGNPNEDIKLARAIVNASKNRQIIEENNRKIAKKQHSSSGGAPSNPEQEEEKLTQEEKAFMGAPFNLTKGEILKARTPK